MVTALIIVDPQVDFCPGGALAVAGGHEVMPVINALREKIKPAVTVITQDWHPPTHTSFADNNPGETLFKPRADGQMMWPRHCVQGSAGAEFHSSLQRDERDYIIKKGTRPTVDSYSGFGSEPLKRREPCAEGSPDALGAEDKRLERTDLEGILRANGVDAVIVVGLAFDYCVAATAKDAAALGYATTVIRSATRAVAPESAATAEAEMRAAGVIILEDYTPAEVIRVHQESQVRLVNAVERLKAVDAEEGESIRKFYKRTLLPRVPWWRRLFCLSAAAEEPATRGHPNYGNRRGRWSLEDGTQEVTCHLCGHKERKTRKGWRAEGWTSKVCAGARRA